MKSIISPYIHLFLYDLAEGLGQDAEKVEENKTNFFTRLPAEAVRPSQKEKADEQKEKADKNYESSYVELLSDRENGTFPLFPESDKLYEGYYYPVQLHDTYGLLLDCSIKNRTAPQPASSFKELKNLIEDKLRGAAAKLDQACYIQDKMNRRLPTLGETWMLSGQLPSSQMKDTEILALAQNCYQALMPDADWKKNFQGQGRLLGGTIFELWSTSQPLNNTKQEHHVIIALYPDDKAVQATAFLIKKWLRFFAYRSKILWAYNQSHILKKQLKQDFTVIEECVRELLPEGKARRNSLKDLEKILDKAQRTLSTYAIDIHDLEAQIHTIAINLQNYKKWLVRTPGEVDAEAAEAHKDIEIEKNRWLIQALQVGLVFPNLEIAKLIAKGEEPKTDINFFNKFSNVVSDEYLLQLRKDYEGFSPGLRLLEVLINTIRANVEVYQEESNRTLQIIIALVGVGLSFSSAVASISAQFPTVIVPVDVQTLEDPPNPARQNPIGSMLFDMGVPEEWLAPAISGVATLLPALLVALCLISILICRRSRSRRR